MEIRAYFYGSYNLVAKYNWLEGSDEAHSTIPVTDGDYYMALYYGAGYCTDFSILGLTSDYSDSVSIDYGWSGWTFLLCKIGTATSSNITFDGNRDNGRRYQAVIFRL